MVLKQPLLCFVDANVINDIPQLPIFQYVLVLVAQVSKGIYRQNKDIRQDFPLMRVQVLGEFCFVDVVGGARHHPKITSVVFIVAFIVIAGWRFAPLAHSLQHRCDIRSYGASEGSVALYNDGHSCVHPLHAANDGRRNHD